MTLWQITAPDGTLSVSANEGLLQANTTYIRTEMNRDHFWDISGNEDRRHKFAQMPKYEDGVAATPTSPTLADGMDLAFFARLKTAAEAVSAGAQNVQPYVRNTIGVTGIMQLLGIRACGVFTLAGGVSTMVYSHNCTIVRDGTGKFTISFTEDLPSSDYLFLGGAIASSLSTVAAMSCQIEPSLTLGPVKDKAFVKIRTIKTLGETSGDVTRITTDPLQGYFVVFGG